MLTSTGLPSERSKLLIAFSIVVRMGESTDIKVIFIFI